MPRVFLVVSILLIGICSVSGKELIPNHNMSDLDESGWPRGWPRGRNATIELVSGEPTLMLKDEFAGFTWHIRLEPDYGPLKLSLEMRTHDIIRGDEGWKDARVAMSFHNDKGERVGEWPYVVNQAGTHPWTRYERLYSIPEGATMLKLNPCILGPSGQAELRNISLTVTRSKTTSPCDAPLPPGFSGDPWSIDDAWSERTPTRERLSLNGLWGFRPLLEGDPEQQVPAAGNSWGWFKVPGIWPGSLYDQNNGAQQIWFSDWLFDNNLVTHKFDTAWYKRRFTIPQHWQGRRIALEFTMLQTHARLFVDGRELGELWFPGGEFDLTPALTPGQEHELALLVTALPLADEQRAFMAPDRIVTSKAGVKLKGLTGDLFLNATPAGARLVDAHVITSLQKQSIGFKVESYGLGEGEYQLEAEIEQDGKKVQTFSSQLLRPDSSGTLYFESQWRDPALWDTHTTSNRYRATITLRQNQGAVVDTLTPVSFGFREFRIKGRDFMLNNKRIHLRALHCGSASYRADKASRQGALEMCRRMAEYGFNLLIVSNYDFAPGEIGYFDGLLEACNESGILVSFSLPHIKDFKPSMHEPEVAARYQAQCEWLIRRVRNHPSVVLYAMNHNCTGYYGDQNPLKIDGIYEMPSPGGDKLPWWDRNRQQARVADEIAHRIDPTRPAYHHQSGNLCDMYTINCYLNWAPIQERNEWFSYWATEGVKPLFLIEWGLPHISSWSSYRGPQFIWRCQAYQSLWSAEFAAMFWGDKAYRDDALAVAALDTEANLWAEGKPFEWYRLISSLRAQPQNYNAVQARFADENWRAHRAWGVSAMLPWDQGDFWQRRAVTPLKESDQRWQGLKQPGIVCDRIQPGDQYIYDQGHTSNFLPTQIGRSMLRWNMPDCGFIAGPSTEFTSTDHHYEPGSELDKSLIILNDRRYTQRVKWTWRLWRRGIVLHEKSGTADVDPGSRHDVPIKLHLPQTALDAERYRLTAVFEFENGMLQTDDFNITTYLPVKSHPLTGTVQLYDPKGATTELFNKLDIKFTRLDGTQPPDPSQLVVLGREALTTNGIAWLPPLAEGGRWLIFEQSAQVMEGLLGFRVAERGARQLFKHRRNSITITLQPDSLRDWNGSATLLSPWLEDLPEAELHDPRWQWCGFSNTRVWRCGNHGNVASVLLEKPARGNWRAMIDGEFDMQYTPLLEYVEGRGRALFCQLDVSGRTTPDPVAHQMTLSMVRYMHDSSYRHTAVNTTWSNNEQVATLMHDLGVVANHGKPGNRHLLVAGPGTLPPPNLELQVSRGMNLLCLGLSAQDLAAWWPEVEVGATTNATFQRIKKLLPELAGLQNGDWAWHGRVTFDPLIIPEEERAQASPSLRVIYHGKGRVVIWQVPPWMIDEKTHPYLRTSKRRANVMASRLLGNLGAELRSPLTERIRSGVESAWLKSYYLDQPEAGDDPYRYYRW